MNLHSFLILILISSISCRSNTSATDKTQMSTMADTITHSTIPALTNSLKVDTIPEVNISSPPENNKGTTLKDIEDQPSKQTSSNLTSLSLDFISIGSGIDIKILKLFDAQLKRYKQEGKEVKHTVTNWGKEGERKYCFTGEGNPYLNDFWEEAEIYIKGNRLILVKVNDACE